MQNNYLLIIPKSHAKYVQGWYDSIEEEKFVFMYEKEETYLVEYEALLQKYPNLQKSKIMKYYERFHSSSSSTFTFTVDFDLFQNALQEYIQEKKYGRAIEEICTYLPTLSNPIQRAILYHLWAKCRQHSGFSEYEVIELYEKSFETCPDYFPPFYELLVKYRLAGLFQKGVSLFTRFLNLYSTPTLFQDSTKYEEFIENVVKKNHYLSQSLYTYLYYVEFEAIICHIHSAEAILSSNREEAIKLFEIAYQLCNRILLRKMVIADESIKQIQHFRARCIDHLKERFISYPAEKIQKICERFLEIESDKEKKVIFTVTTCKRFDLFEKTMNALIHCTKDIDMIGEWLCVDDNSSEADRALMKERYPFFTFIWKSPEEKGHARSMNIIRDYVIKSGYKYTLHMEDDWVAVCEMEYIKPAIQIIEESREGVKQVVQNRQYVQLIRPRDIDLKGGFQRYTQSGMRYILHEFYPKGSTEESNFWKRVGGGFSASYWPHYSLNPSIMSCDVYSLLGSYREDVRHFEMDYASRFTNAGFKTAFFDNITRLHIGKLIGEEGKKNAYELNELQQF